MARGWIGGMVSGALASGLVLGAVSVALETPAGNTPPAAPLVDAPDVAMVDVAEVEAVAEDVAASPVGSVEVAAPEAPDLPDESGAFASDESAAEPEAPQVDVTEPIAPQADTDPAAVPDVAVVENTLEAPTVPETGGVTAQLDDPVLPNPQALAPQTPNTEADLTVSTAPATPLLVEEPENIEVDPVEVADTDAVAAGAAPVAEAEAEDQDFFVVDLGADAAPSGDVANQDSETTDAPVDPAETDLVADAGTIGTPRLTLQGSENTLLTDRNTGVVIRRPAAEDTLTDASAEETSAEPNDPEAPALERYAADAAVTGGLPLMSIVLIDDGSMSAASAALSGLPFPVSIALDSAGDGAAERMQSYREDGFEVVVMTAVPEGALPTDVEITFESVFSTLPESVALLDLGTGGLQADRDVTEQAMSILADQGRGFITVSQGLNMASRAAEQAGVPSAVVYRDLDPEDQDARVVRRFVDQAAFRARQESGVVLVGRVRPDTISALILWATANADAQVALVPVSAVLLDQE
ncbi:MAG: divergent polysaccharide deacetylase family protein [Pseudomonadota bacterium]